MRLSFFVASCLAIGFTGGFFLGRYLSFPTSRGVPEQIGQLQRTIEELQAQIKRSQSNPPSSNHIGNWLIAETDRSTANFTDLKFNVDGTGFAVHRNISGAKPIKYTVTGKQIDIEFVSGGVTAYIPFRVVSVDAKEMVLGHPDDKVPVVRYIRQ